MVFGMPQWAQGETLNRSGPSEARMAFALRLAESRTSAVDECRQLGAAEGTFCTSKNKFSDLRVVELKRLMVIE